MTDSIDASPARRSLLDIVERASLFAILQQALQHQHKTRLRDVPPRLYDDLGIPPSQRPDFNSRFF